MSDDTEHVAQHRLPGAFYDPLTGSSVSRSIPVTTASVDDVKRYSELKAVCGECHHFMSMDDYHVTALLTQGRMLVRLIDEYEWKLHHAFPGGVQNAGFCDSHGYITQVFAAAKDCAYTPQRGAVRRKATESALFQLHTDRTMADKMGKKRDREFRRNLNKPGER